MSQAVATKLKGLDMIEVVGDGPMKHSKQARSTYSSVPVVTVNCLLLVLVKVRLNVPKAAGIKEPVLHTPSASES